MVVVAAEDKKGIGRATRDEGRGRKMMVVKGCGETERNRISAGEGFNAQLKKRSDRVALSVGGAGIGRIFGERRDRGYGDGSSTSSRSSTRKATGDVLAAEATTYQRVRRILEEHARRQDYCGIVGGSGSSPNSRVLSSNYTIVASSTREERCSRRNAAGRSFFSSFSVCETHRRVAAAAPSSRGNRLVGDTGRRIRESSGNESRITREKKSVKVPAVVFVAEASGRNDVFAQRERDRASWARGHHRVHPENVDGNENLVSDRRNRSCSRLVPASFAKNARTRQERAERRAVEGVTAASRHWKENGTITTSSARRGEYGHAADLRRSPSSPCRTLPNSWKKNVTVKKSVSFSSDTSFEEKRSLVRAKTTIHEAKVYRKGVLQDRGSTSPEDSGRTLSARTATSTTTSTSGGTAALLRAARTGNDGVLGNILIRSRTSEAIMDGIDINARDSSGRTTVSYLAGNGTVALLEAALCFPNVDVNLADNEGNTPLHFATQAGQVECVSVLLQRCSGIEVDARNGLGFTPLMKAAIQGRTKCAKLLLFAGANPTLRDQGRGLRAEQWARFCGRYVCAEVIERFARHRLLERTTSCRWGSEPELAARVLQGKVTPVPTNVPQQSTGLRSKIRRVFRTSSGPDNRRSFSLVSQLTSAALCASSPALPRSGEVPPVVKSLIRPLSVPQLRITLVTSPEIGEPVPYKPPTTTTVTDKYQTSFTEKIVSEKIDSSITKPPRTKKKNK